MPASRKALAPKTSALSAVIASSDHHIDFDGRPKHHGPKQP